MISFISSRRATLSFSSLSIYSWNVNGNVFFSHNLARRSDSFFSHYSLRLARSECVGELRAHLDGEPYIEAVTAPIIKKKKSHGAFYISLGIDQPIKTCKKCDLNGNANNRRTMLF